MSKLFVEKSIKQDEKTMKKLRESKELFRLLSIGPHDDEFADAYEDCFQLVSYPVLNVPFLWFLWPGCGSPIVSINKLQ